MEQALRPDWLGPDESIGPIISSKDTATNVVTGGPEAVHQLNGRRGPEPPAHQAGGQHTQVINSVAHNTLVDDEDVKRGFVDKDDRWDEFRSRLIKWIILAECYPYRVSLLVLQILDREQKAMVNKSVWQLAEWGQGSSSTVRDRLGNVDGPPPDPAFEDPALASAVFSSTWRRNLHTRESAKMAAGWRRRILAFCSQADRDTGRRGEDDQIDVIDVAWRYPRSQEQNNGTTTSFRC